jgi:hypothetical protein
MQGAIELARLLVSCPCLASLCLRGCGLHQEGGAALGAALPQARRLIKLDLSANRCGAVNGAGCTSWSAHLEHVS